MCAYRIVAFVMVIAIANGYHLSQSLADEAIGSFSPGPGLTVNPSSIDGQVSNLPFLVAQAAGTSNSAQNPAASTQTISNMAPGLTVPTSPAFSILGLNPQQVTRPSTPKELATSLLSGVDPNGNIQNGLALDFVPFMILKGDQLTVDQYRDPANYVDRLLARTSLSLGTVKGASSNDKSARLAGGLRATLVDAGDPREDEIFATCLGGKLSFPPLPPGTVVPTGQSPTGFKEVTTAAEIQAWDECKAESRQRNWNRSAWDIGAAISANSPTGTYGNITSSSKGFYTSLGYGFDEFQSLSNPTGLAKNSYIIIYLQYIGAQLQPNPQKSGSFFLQNMPAGAVSYIFGPSSDFNLQVTGGVTGNLPQGRPSTVSYTVTGGTEFKLTDGLWLQLAVGGSTKTANNNGSAFVLSQLKFSLLDQQSKPPTLPRPGVQ